MAFALTACQSQRKPGYTGYTPPPPAQSSLAKGPAMTEPYVVDGVRYTPMSVEQAVNYKARGEAAWYGDEIYLTEGGNRTTANGERFDENMLTAGHKTLPLPSYVKVTDLQNNRSVVVRVNDRGPFHADRLIVLSKAAADALGYEYQGTAPVMIEVLQVGGNTYPIK